MEKKLTKIVATISDLNCEIDHLQALFNSGVNVVRLNTAHQGFDGALKVIENVRKISQHVAIMVDTKGPEVRTQNIETPLQVKEGDIIEIVKKITDPNKQLETNYPFYIEDVNVGQQVLVDDGEMAMIVIEKKIDKLVCRISNTGVIKNRKSINTPGAILARLSAVSEKDKDFIKFSCENDIDFIAHSFVRNKGDILAIQKLLDEGGSQAKIIAKIENQEGVDNIHEILEVAYGVMVARGDLGIEIPFEQVPIAQRKMIEACQLYASPVITATQMLHTMIENPRPTRAEVSDIANAIYQGTDAVMLSGETAYGKYPLEAVQTQAKIALAIEEDKPSFTDHPVFQDRKVARNYLSKAAVEAIKDLNIKAVLVDTKTGRTARILSSYRSRVPIFARTTDASVMRSLSLCYGVQGSLITEPVKNINTFVVESLEELKAQGHLKGEDLIVMLIGSPNRDLNKGTEILEINTVDKAIASHKEAL